MYFIVLILLVGASSGPCALDRSP